MSLKNINIFLLSLIATSTMHMLSTSSFDSEEHADEALWFTPQNLFPFVENNNLRQELPLVQPIVVDIALPLTGPLDQQEAPREMRIYQDRKRSAAPPTRTKRKMARLHREQKIAAAHVAARDFIDGKITYEKLDRIVKKAMVGRTAMLDR